MSPAPSLTVQQALSLALQHHQAGRLRDAEALYRHILALEPGHPEALHNLGVIAYQVGRHELAIDWLQKAIAVNPQDPGRHFNLGEACRAMNRLDDAIACYRHALELQPSYPEAQNSLGTALAGLERREEAVAAFRRALELRPNYPDAYNKLAITLAAQGRLDEAIATFRQALEIAPEYPETHINLGNALNACGQPEAAVASLRRALQIQPDLLAAHYNLGNTLRDQGHLDEAAACYRHVLKLNPRFPDAHLGLGLIAWREGNFREAEARYREAIAGRPDFATAHLNLGLLLLLLGRYAEGWPEYEWRWRTPEYARHLRTFSAPQWDGTPAAGKTILIHAEQGFGDALLFSRYLPLVRAHSGAARIILECQPALVPLLRQLHRANIDVVARSEADDALPPFDLHLPLFSVPLALHSFAPVSGPAYLEADAGLRARWRERLGPANGLRMGLAWAGNPGQRDDRRRSIAPEKLAPILGVPGIQVVSLQVEPRGALPPKLSAAGILDLTADIADFADTAALMAELDLILTVDTATAHLAGALGRPTWVLAPFVPYWPYGLGREDTPWYPTMRLFRQTAAGDWADAIERVAGALRAWHA